MWQLHHPCDCDARNLGVNLNAHLTMLRQIPSATTRLESAFALSTLKYCYVVLAGLPHSALLPMQCAQNTAYYKLWQLDHITPVMKQLHWLPIKLYVKFKLCL